jgi:voltage-gated potassium channel Kch
MMTWLRQMKSKPVKSFLHDYMMIKSTAILEETPHLQSNKFRWRHLRTVLISGVGFMTDAYDLFIIAIIIPMLSIVYFDGKIDPLGEGLVKGAAAWGTLFGQLVFGILYLYFVNLKELIRLGESTCMCLF